MLLKFCSSVVFCVIVRFRVVWFRLCVALVMLIVRFIANGVVLSELASLIVMLNAGSVVSIPVVLYCCGEGVGAAPVPFCTLKVISVRLMSGVVEISVFWFFIMSWIVVVRLVLLFRLLLFCVAFCPVICVKFMLSRVMLNVVSGVWFVPTFDESVAFHLNVHAFTVMLLLLKLSCVVKLKNAWPEALVVLVPAVVNVSVGPCLVTLYCIVAVSTSWKVWLSRSNALISSVVGLCIVALVSFPDSMSSLMLSFSMVKASSVVKSDPVVVTLFPSVSVALNLNILLVISLHWYERLNSRIVLAHEVQVCSPISTKFIGVLFDS